VTLRRLQRLSGYDSGPLTIRRRLILTFVFINLLYALNVGLYLWSNARRKNTINDLQTAVLAEKTLTAMRQSLRNIQRQMTLMGQSMDASNSASTEETDQFRGQLQSVKQLTDSLLPLSTGEGRQRAEALSASYEKLSASWLIFYENYGVRHATAIMEMAIRAEPLSQSILEIQVPALLDQEKRHVEVATANFNYVAQLTERITLLIFTLSGLTAAASFIVLSRYLTRSLGALKAGAAAIGAQRLDYKIEFAARDELGELANAFNDMAGKLGAAREEARAATAEVASRNRQIEAERQVSESLLLNILPAQIADELRLNKSVEPKYFEDVSILFTDFVGFTLSTENLAAENLVQQLNEYFTAFDRITERYGIEKLKTIGDSYMCVAGMPVRNPSHPIDLVLAAFEMVQVVEELGRRPGGVTWAVRVGIHTGPVIAGVVGIHKFAFDIWGDSVNYSSRMESSGAANQINISERTYSRVKDFIQCRYRGRILTKDKREVDMYFAEGILPELTDDPTLFPGPAFLRRYRIYFQKEPAAFPASFPVRRGLPDPAPAA
jgi:class 3 adenylate cyclase